MLNSQIALSAKEKAEKGPWHYLVGGAENEFTLRRNRHCYQNYGLIPKTLNDISKISINTEFLGLQLETPWIAAPVGGMTQFHENGEMEWAKGCAQANILGVVSGVSRIPPKKVFDSGSGNMFYQIYIFGDERWVDEQIQAAKETGFKALVVTVDTAYFGQRERDDFCQYDPRFSGWREAPHPPDRSKNGTFNWEWMEKIVKKHDLPMILKGIVHPEDILKAKEIGVNAIWNSNHGGRQLDYSVDPLEHLKTIAPLCKANNLKLISDGGIRRGSDVFMQLLFGADIVALGRLPMYGLIDSGANGIESVFNNLKTEFLRTLGLMGITDVKQISQLGDKAIKKLENPRYYDCVWDNVEENNFF